MWANKLVLLDNDNGFELCYAKLFMIEAESTPQIHHQFFFLS